MNTTLRSLAACATLALGLAAAPSTAAAAQVPQGRSHGGGRGSQMFSFWGVFDPGPVDGAGVGGRVMFPLVPQGVLHSPSVRDEFTLEVGADIVHYSDTVGFAPYYVDYSWNGVLPVVGATWNFWFTPRFALYPKLDLGWWIGSYSGWDGRYGYVRHDFDGVFLQGALGLVYRLDSVALRVEAGSGLLRIGVGIPF